MVRLSLSMPNDSETELHVRRVPPSFLVFLPFPDRLSEPLLRPEAKDKMGQVSRVRILFSYQIAIALTRERVHFFLKGSEKLRINDCFVLPLE